MFSFKRILVVSDSHGDRHTLQNILERHTDAACVFHLGDGAQDMLSLQNYFPGLTVFTVVGNCDRPFLPLPVDCEERVAGITVFATHGHTYGVKQSLLPFTDEAHRRGVSLALFGHTHTPFVSQENGLCLLNPGSVMSGSHYALIDVQPSGLFPHLETFR